MTDPIVHSAAAREQFIIDRMMRQYLSELGVADEYRYLRNYWTEPKVRFPYLIRQDRTVLGFALVRVTGHVEMADFYVLPDYRRTGVGRKAVHELLQKHSDDWIISVLPGRASAYAFWSTVLPKTGFTQIDLPPEDEGVSYVFRRNAFP